MFRRLVVVTVVLLGFGAFGLLITLLQTYRLNAHLKQSQFNLAQLSFFAAHHARPDPGQAARLLPHEVPSGTIPLPGVVPENRLSWAVAVLPWLADRKFTTDELVRTVRPDRPWNDEANQQVARATLAIFLCPEKTPPLQADAPAPTCYVGMAGLGNDAASLVLQEGVPTPPRAGPFRYEGPTPFERITDGLSQTLLIGETADAPGPWLRGGPATVRGIDDATGAKPLIGSGGQFGGFFPMGANFSLCDGSVRLFTPQTTPGIFYRLATIAGATVEVGPTD